MIKHARLVALLLTLPSCAAVDISDGFDGVADLVEERSGQRILWQPSDGQSADISATLDGLLARPLTAETAARVTLLSNPALRATYAEMGIARADLAQAGRLKNPVFDAVFSAPLEGGQIDLDLGVAFELLDILYVPLRKRVAEAQFEAARVRVAGVVLDRLFAARTAYLNVLAARQRRDLFEQVAVSTAASHQVAQALRAAGNITALDVARQRVLAEQAALDLAKARAGEAEAREGLTLAMGLSGARAAAWTIAGRLPDPPAAPIVADGLEAEALDRSLELAEARHGLDALGRRHRVTNAKALFPEIEAGAVAERDEGAWEVGPAIALPLPLFDQGQARRARARAEILQAQDRGAALMVEIAGQARKARQRLAVARERVLVLRDTILPVREQIVDETLKQYNAMQVGVFDLLFARQQQIATADRYIAALADYWRARAHIDQLRAGRMPAGAGTARLTAIAMDPSMPAGDH